MATLESFVKYVGPEAERCPRPLLLRALLDAAIEFCHESLIATETLAAFDLDENVHTYTLTPTTGYEVISLKRLEMDDEPLEITSEKLLDANGANWRHFETATPTKVYQPLPNTVRFVPTPDADSVVAESGIVAEVYIQPSDDATAVPDVLYEFYRRAIAAGALAILCDMRDQPWTNRRVAAARRADFVDAIQRAKFKVDGSFAVRNQRVRIPRFGP